MINFEKQFDNIESKFKDIEISLNNQKDLDTEKLIKLNKEYAELTPIVETIKKYKFDKSEIKELSKLIEDSDPSIKELAETELKDKKKSITQLEHELMKLLIPKDENDKKNSILEIRAGTGGDEASLFAADLFSMYQKFSDINNWKFEILSISETGLKGIKEVICNISGYNVFSKLKFESGVHRVQRIPSTESSGRVHTSAATVAVLPEAEEVDINIEDKDLRIDVFRSSGPGGQSVNTTDSAVRITHIPTGIVCQCQNERSQHIQYFEVEREKKASHLTHEGVSEAQKQAGIGSFYVGNNMDFPHLLENALRAHAVYQKDKDYVVQNGDVVIVDEFTGRLMIGRQWSDGLHQAVEAKEQVKIKQETQTLATVTIQNFFKLYKRLAGMTGTAITEATEFNEIYGLDVVCIPTNATVVRYDRDDLIYLSQKDKWDAILDEIKSNHDMGRPVLVGTTSVEKSERLSEMLTRKYSIAHEVLNAKQHEREAHIVEHAGELGAVMIATNMAGRGTDIRLAQVGRSSLVRHWQQRNLLPKKASVEASNEELAMLSYRHQAGQQLGLKGKELDALGDDEVRLRLLRRWCTEQTLLDSEKIEKASIAFCERALDNVPGFVRHRMEIYDRIEQMGGLHIVGTERHEARRIDNQLRGRSGRQGDQGSSRFFIALDDDLMQLFAKGWLMKALPKMGMKEGDAIEHRWITKSVERAQRKVEERNYEIRKNLLEYDEVMEHQRNAFYSIRQKVLDGEDIEQIIFGYISEAVEDACDQYLDVDYIPTQVAEWCRQNLDVSVDASKLRIGDLSDLKTQARSEARAEARQALEVTLGEYMSDDIPQENWDLRNLSRWAMSRFSVDLKQSHLRQMNIDAVTEVLTEAADEQIEKKELSGVAKFLEPLYAANDLAEWAQQKFEINIKAESLAPQQGEKSADTKRRVVEIVLDEAISAYRRRQVTYPVDFVLDMAGQIAQQDRQVAAEQLARWANQRFELDWQAESILEQEFPVLRQQLIDESEQWHHNGRLDSVVDQAIAEQNGDPVELSKWVQNRFGQVASKEDLMGLDRDALRAILLNKGQAMLRTELTQLERFVLLQILDMAWKDHLYVMDQIKDSVSLRGYAEKDPRIEYKREGANQFLQMQKTVRDRVTELIFRARLTPNVESRSVYSQQEARHADVGDLLSDSATAAAGTQQQREDLEAAERAGAEQSTAPRSRRQRRAAAAEKLNDGKPVRAKSEFKRRKKRSR